VLFVPALCITIGLMPVTRAIVVCPTAPSAGEYVIWVVWFRHLHPLYSKSQLGILAGFYRVSPLRRRRVIGKVPGECAVPENDPVFASPIKKRERV